MRKICLIGTIFVTVTLALAGCTSHVTIKRTVPAKYHISGIKRVAFIPFTYEMSYHEKGSTTIPEILEDALRENGFFEVVKGPDISLKMDEKISTVRLRKICRSSGADAVVSGKVMAYQATTDTREIPVEKYEETGRYRLEKYEEGGQIKYRRIPITEKVTYYETEMQKSAEVSFYADLASGHTGKVLDHRYFSKIGTKKAQGDDEIRKMSSDDKMLRGVAEEVAKKFVLAMTPHEISQKIAFKSEKPCKDGIKAAKKGRWDEASASWNNALAIDPNCSCAYYNLGLAQEVKREYPASLESYKKASNLAPEDKLYSRAVKRVENIIKGEKILKTQMKGRE